MINLQDILWIKITCNHSDPNATSDTQAMYFPLAIACPVCMDIKVVQPEHKITGDTRSMTSVLKLASPGCLKQPEQVCQSEQLMLP